MSFRGRRSKFSMRRRPRRKLAWLAAANSLCSVRMGLNACDFEGIDQVEPDFFSLVDNPAPTVPGQVDQATEVTLLRVVGDLVFYSNVSATDATEPQLQNVLFYWGVFIADVSLKGFSDYDPTISADAASGDWLARGVSVHPYAAGLGPTTQCQISLISTPEAHPHFDLRVKRKLRASEQIVLAVKCVQDNPFPSGTDRLLTTGQLYASMRALVALP